MEALQTQAFFIGAMGSEHTSAARRKRPGPVGISAGQLQRLHAPIGIPIASKTPPEIALSAVTQLTGIRNRLRRSEFSGRLAGGYDDVCLPKPSADALAGPGCRTILPLWRRQTAGHNARWQNSD